MDITKVSLQTVKYIITKCEITTTALKEPYSVPNLHIVEFVIDDDFESFYYPFFQIKLNLPSTVLRAIKKDPLKTYISLTIKQAFYDSKSGDVSEGSKSISTFLDGKYIAYIEDQNRSLLDSVVEDNEESLGYNVKTADPDTDQTATFTLYNEKLDDALSTKINAIISSGCLVDVLGFVLTTAGINNVLLSPPNNYKTYAPFILPPQSASSHIDRICNDYGIHTQGSLIYYGLDRNYILSRDLKCTAYSTNEYQITYLYYPGPGNERLAGFTYCGKSNIEKANYITIDPSSVKFSDLSVYAENVSSDKFVMIDPAKSTINGSTGTYVIRNGGDDIRTALEKRTASYSKTASLSFRGIDLNMLTPNKQFTITVDDKKFKKFNGNYRLLKKTSIFVKDGTMFTPMTMCNFSS